MISFPYTSQVTYDANGMPKYDRPSNAEQQRELNKTLYANGVDMRIATAFMTTPGTGMTVIVNPGILHLDGVFGFETTNRTLTVQASQNLDRIDRVIARVDFNTAMRTLDLYVLKGTASASPAAPALTRTTSVYEIALADIFVAKNTAVITAQRITDLRMNDALCGTFTNAFGKIDYTPYFTQLQAMIRNIEAEITAIEQGSAVMLKSVFVGKTADSVKKADSAETCTGNAATATIATTCTGNAATATTATTCTGNAATATTATTCTGNAATATTATTCTGNAATVGDNSTLAYAGAITTTPWLAAWEGKSVRCIAPDNVTVGNANHLKGLGVGVSDEGAYIILRKNGKDYKYTDAIRAVVAETCTGHAALDAYAPQEAAFIRESAETKTSFFSYPNGCDQNNCLVIAVFSNELQFYGSRWIAAQSIGVTWRDVPSPDYPNFKPTKVIVQRYK